MFDLNIYANNCNNCHAKEYSKCKNSVHFTLKNAINITREAWGLKGSDFSLQNLPKPKEKIKIVSDLVDDLLRKKCLRCHLGKKLTSNSCLMCHKRHSLNNPKHNKIKNEKCLKCHNTNYVGTDYLGLFPKDYHKDYRAPLDKWGKYPKTKYGIDFHHLQRDIHFKKGMLCVDCHNNKISKDWQNIKCENCHKNISEKYHPNYHKNITCSACHSLWNISNYEYSLLRDDTKNYKKWNKLILCEDEYLTRFLLRAKKDKNIEPKMRDFVDNTSSIGIWYRGYRYRRWEDFILGVRKKDNKITIIRPFFQYHVSYKNKNGKVVFDNIYKLDDMYMEAWIPYAPHTISKKAKSCEMCHNNKLQFQKKNSVFTLDLKIPKRFVKCTPLLDETLKRLKSKRYKRARAKMLMKIK